MRNKLAAVLATLTLAMASLILPAQAAFADEPAAADISVIELKDALCQFTVQVTYPLDSLPDEGSQVLRITSPSGNLEGGVAWTTLQGKGSSYFTRTTFNGINLLNNLKESDAWFNGQANFNSQWCGIDFTLEVTYTHNGIPSAVASKTIVSESYLTSDYIYAWKEISPEGYCELYIDFHPGHLPDDDGVSGRVGWVTYSEQGLDLAFTVLNPTADDITYRFATETVVDAESTIISMQSSGAVDGCGEEGRAEFGYVSLGQSNWEIADVAPLPICGKGTFSSTGHYWGWGCVEAPVGYYVDDYGAKAPTICPNGQTTEQPGAASERECFSTAVPTFDIRYLSGTGLAPSSPLSVDLGASFTLPANTFKRTGYTFAGWSDGAVVYAPGSTYANAAGDLTLSATWKVTHTAKRLSALKVLKVGVTKSLLATSDQGKATVIKASGACKSKQYTLKGKRMLKITASKNSGVCTLSVSSPETSKITALKTTLKIRVSKTGR